MQAEYRAAQTKRATLVGAVVNAILGIGKVWIGWFGQSHALLADGIHSLSDLLCDAMVLFAGHFGAQEADDDHPYGHRRIETIATYTLGIFLLLVGLGIAWDAIQHVITNQSMVPDRWTLVAALVSIVANEFLFWYTLRIGKRIDSDLLRANAWHSRADSLSSIVVLFGILGAMMGWPHCDSIAAIIVALFIVKLAIQWLWKAGHELADAGLNEEQLHQIREIIANTDGVMHSHRLRTRKMAERIFLDVHIEIPPYISASEGHYIAECVRVTLMKTFSEIADVTVHVDVEDHPESLPKKMLPSRAEIRQTLDPLWEKTLPLNKIKGMQLHYVGYQIEIELLLDRSLLDSKASTREKALSQSLKAVPKLKAIKVIYG